MKRVKHLYKSEDYSLDVHFCGDFTIVPKGSCCVENIRYVTCKKCLAAYKKAGRKS